MKVNEQINKESKVGTMLPEAGTFKVTMSDGEKKILHVPKGMRFSGKIKDFNEQEFCVVCGREAQIGSHFCSMSCQKEQYGV